MAPELTRELPPLVLAEANTAQAVLSAHMENMKAYGVCRARYEALVEVVREEHARDQ